MTKEFVKQFFLTWGITIGIVIAATSIILAFNWLANTFGDEAFVVALGLLVTGVYSYLYAKTTTGIKKRKEF